MCGPTKEIKSLNDAVQKNAADMKQEASQIFGDASSVFNNLMGSLQSIVKGGPSQQGWSAAQTNAVNSQIMDQAAVNARNQKAAIGNAVSAIGGGNTVNPSGLEAAVNMQTNQAVEQEKSRQLEQAQVANYQQGNENYFNAVSGEAKLPGIMTVANEANKNVMEGYNQATISQKNIDAQQGGLMHGLEKAIGAGLNMVPGVGPILSAGFSGAVGGDQSGGGGGGFGGGFSDLFSMISGKDGKNTGNASYNFGGPSSVDTTTSSLPWSIS